MRTDLRRLRPGEMPSAGQLNELFRSATRTSRVAGAPGANVVQLAGGTAITDDQDEQFRAEILPDSGFAGQQALAEAILDPSGDGQITGIQIDNQGAGYDPFSPPDVTFSPDDNGNVPEAEAQVSSAGLVVAIVIVNQQGIFYSSPPSVSIDSPMGVGTTTGPNYAWREVAVAPQGQVTVVQGGRSGTVGSCPAWEENGALAVPAGTIVWLRVGQYADGNPDYRFFYPTSLFAPIAPFFAYYFPTFPQVGSATPTPLDSFTAGNTGRSLLAFSARFIGGAGGPSNGAGDSTIVLAIYVNGVQVAVDSQTFTWVINPNLFTTLVFVVYPFYDEQFFYFAGTATVIPNFVTFLNCSADLTLKAGDRIDLFAYMSSTTFDNNGNTMGFTLTYQGFANAVFASITM